MSKFAKSNRGFTIIELMIATAVFSTILVITSGMMIKIGNLYYKGISQVRIQDSVRNITDEVSAHMRLSDSSAVVHVTAPGGVHAYCIGNIRYSFVFNRQVVTAPTAPHETLHALWRDDNPTPGSGCTPALGFPNVPTASTNGAELIAPNARLTQFSISPQTSPYTLIVAAAYGDDDLMILNGENTRCKGDIGDEFCATAHLTTTIVRRLSNT